MKYKTTIKREQSQINAWTLPSMSSFDVVKLLRFSFLSVLVMLCGSVFADQVTMKYSGSTTTNMTGENDAALLGLDANEWSVVGAKGAASNFPGLNKAGDFRLYYHANGSNTITVKSLTDATINSISMTFNSDYSNVSVTVDGNAVSATDGTWTINSNEFILGNGNSSNTQVQIKELVIDYTPAGGQADTRATTKVTLTEGYATTGEVGSRIALPRYTVTAGNGSVLESAIVTWESSNTNVATIDAENKVINLIAAGKTTIKATYAGDETNYKPSTASYTLTVTPQTVIITSLRDLQNQVTSTSTPANITFRDVQVVYVNGDNAYLADANGYGALLYTKNHGLEAGQVLNGTNAAKIVLYQGNAEITDFTKEGLTISKTEVTPTVTTINAITKAQQSTLVTLKNVTASVSEDGKTITLADGDKTITFYDKFKSKVTIENGKTYDVTGVIALYYETIEICPRTVDDVAEVQAQEPEPSGFRNIKANLTSTDLIPADAVQWEDVSTGIKIAEDGTLSRIAKEGADIVFNGKWHGTQYGWANFSATVKVDGCVKITVGQTNVQGKDMIVKDANNTQVAKLNTAGSLWKSSNPTENVVVDYYRINEPTTLTFEYGSYLGYFAVEAIDESEIPAEVTNYTATFSKGDTDCEGEVPTALTVEAGSKVKIPANTTLYKEGYTLTAWTDGTNQYKAGDEITLTENVTLAPVFTANEVSLADRTSTVHLEWPLGVSSGAGKINIEGKKGVIVCQTIVNEKKIDVKMEIDATSGKINNVGRTDQWAQVNAGTKFTIPSCKGAYFTTEAYKDITTTTIAGETDYTPGKNIEYFAKSNAETIDIVIGDGEYYSIVKIDLPVVAQEESKFVDIKADFTNQNFLTDEEKAGIADESNKNPSLNFGLSIGEDGSATRVASDAANANAIITGKWHSKEHGISNFSATVKVEGPVQIYFGTCAWGGDVTVKNAEGAVVATMNTNTGACYHDNTAENVVSCYYKQDEATTLTISGGSYVPFFAVLKVDPKDIPSDVKFIFDITESGAEGVAPAEEIAGIGKKYTLPKNFTLYKEGATLTGWTDGTNTYAPGEEITAPDAESVTLTPVFTANTVSLADRTEPVTLKYNFRRDAGAPTVAYQNATGIWVAQATIGDKVIDVKADFDTNNGGKFANGAWTDWAQLNNGTKWTIPSCKGATVSIEAFSELGAAGKTATTIDGQTDYTSGKTINYTVASAAETVDVVIGNDGSYYRYIQVVLPVVQSQGGGEKYENVHAKVEWFMNDAANPGANYSEPDGVFTTVAFDYGDAEITGTSNITNENAQKETTGIKFKPSGTTKSLVWSIKPAAGLTFTPTRIAGYVNRCGTDVENGITVSARVGDGEPIVLGTWTALRSGKTSAQKPYDATAIYLYAIDLTAEQQAALTSGETLFLESTIGVGAAKEGAFGEVVIDGLINGEKADIAMYTLTTAANPAEGGSVSTYPVSEQYEAGSEVTLTATENFGYDFVNWTNAAGDEVSTEAKFKHTMTADETLTANFRAVETYELALTIDGTNPYMVTISPAPTLVDGKMMYEAGTTVELNANQYEGLVTFTNWSDGETAANKIVKMDNNVTLSAIYAQADIIAGWDFYKAGGNGRKADFAAADNDADALSLVNTETGETQGWLDKSTEAAGGYESFKGAAVNWRTGSSNGDVGNWHWQTKINAEAFTNITVQFQMLYNYNAYQRYNAEFSTDGENWTNFGSITMEGAKNPASFNETLPEAANNQKDLFIRMIADKTSNVDGSASANDGNTLAMFFITGTPKLVDDPVAPALVSSVPTDGATGASASGKIVLNFDKKVQVVEGAVATLGTMELTPTVSGKVITFEYKGLEYSKEYTFTLPANTVQNLTGATLADAIAINFTTMERPTIEKGLYDEVVSTAEELAAAIKAANERADKSTRYRIFIKKGIYALPSGANKHYTHTNSSTGEVYFNQDRPDPITYVTGGKISFIGEDRDATIITQAAANETFAGQFGTTSIYDGIGNSDVLQLSGDDYYFQDLTIKSGIEDARGRNLAVHDKSKKSIYKNVCLFGYQDTWTSNNDNGLYYFEGGIIRGRTDYICGKGDAYFDQVEFRQIAGGYCAVPSKPANIGWVMKDCVINGDGSGVDGNYTLGRPWGSGTPVAVWIDTKMNVVPSAIGWNEMGTGWPKRFAEYNSTTSTGSVIDLSGRKKTFGDGHTNNPVLTAEEALEYSDKNKMFGDWNPQLMTESAPMVTDVKLVGTILSWTGNSYSLLYAICKNGEIIAYTKDTTFDLSTLSSEEAGSRRGGEESVVYSVRAANEMGGLGEAAEAVVATGIEEIAPATTTADGKVYNLQGIRVDKAQKGLYIINGRKVVIK